MLCVTVQVLLVLEFVIGLTGGYLSDFTIDSKDAVYHLFFFGMPAFGWILLKVPLLEARQNKKNKEDLFRLKRNTQVFESILANQKEIKNEPINLGIKLGNANGKFKLIKVCNPYCRPCAKAHPEIHELLQSNPELGVQIIFTASNDDKDMKAPPVKHLLAIAESQNEAITKVALDDWYNSPKKDYAEFAAKYPLDVGKLQQGDKVEGMYEWCKEEEITFTTTFFIQGKQLPKIYHISDLKYLLQS